MVKFGRPLLVASSIRRFDGSCLALAMKGNSAPVHSVCARAQAHVLHMECLLVYKGEGIWEVGEMKGCCGTLLED